MIAEYTKDEFYPKLGVFIKWIHGDKNEKIEKIYSMSAFSAYLPSSGYIICDEYNKYSEYLLLSTKSIIENTDYHVRIYIDESIFSENNPDKEIWRTTLDEIKKLERIQILCVRFPRYYIEDAQAHPGLLGVMFRYLALFDPNLSVILFRDIDNVWNEQHHYLTKLWLDRGDDVCLFMNEKYKRQQLTGLTEDGYLLEDKYYSAILSGLWNIRKSFDFAYSPTIWQKCFAYIESYTSSVFKPEYKEYKYYGVPFIYGFDEMALARIMIPIFIHMGHTFYAIPIKIYELEYFHNLFDDPILIKFLPRVSDENTLATIKDIMINNYWHMYTENAGLSQYILCILTNIYFNLITKKNKFYKSEVFLNTLRNRVYPNPLLMGIGLFTFKNFDRYNWYPNAKAVVDKFLLTNTPITLEEWTADSDLSNGGNGPESPDPYKI